MKKFIPLGIIAAIAIAFFGLYAYANGVRNTAIQKEEALSAQYQDNQNELSAMVSTFYETLGIADRKSEQLDRILTDAIKGRYDEGSTAAPGGGQLFSAIREAYPDLGGLSIYDKVLVQLQGDRTNFKKVQSKFLDQLRDYDTWRAMGFVRSWALGKDFPSDHLVARIGTKKLTRMAAHEQMELIVLAPDTIKAFDSGTMAPMTMPSLPPRK